MSEPVQAPEPNPLEVAVDDAIAACGGDMRATIKALIVADDFLMASVSPGYLRTPRLLIGRIGMTDHRNQLSVLRKLTPRLTCAITLFEL